ncbi:hypothetical protein VFPFJ_01439 [Purpureocillium lilacinum]|uniref:Uncharacterized protein n=1 Tax=Purpureocillium lilacinum TaxID=33203 RepID=A0A179I0U9_PURLI|nr:hypothetical protein VFPFJ_01439 [Purpureocillium lilacinum]OAQ95329.1 hypothetical protein VFPFJ_01439 [Purpureocillium lilacinum]
MASECSSSVTARFKCLLCMASFVPVPPLAFRQADRRCAWRRMLGANKPGSHVYSIL